MKNFFIGRDEASDLQDNPKTMARMTLGLEKALRLKRPFSGQDTNDRE
jgi:hypothetical protein